MIIRTKGNDDLKLGTGRRDREERMDLRNDLEGQIKNP